MDRADRERLDREPPERREGTIELERRLGRAARAPSRGRPTGSPSSRRSTKLRISAELGVDPLHVVERDKQRPAPERAPARPRPARARARASRAAAHRARAAAMRSRALAAVPAPAAAASRRASARTGRRPSRTRSASRPWPRAPRADGSRARCASPQRPRARARSCRFLHRPRSAMPARLAGTASTNPASACSSARLPMIGSDIAASATIVHPVGRRCQGDSEVGIPSDRAYPATTRKAPSPVSSVPRRQPPSTASAAADGSGSGSRVIRKPTRRPRSAAKRGTSSAICSAIGRASVLMRRISSSTSGGCPSRS